MPGPASGTRTLAMPNYRINRTCGRSSWPLTFTPAKPSPPVPRFVSLGIPTGWELESAADDLIEGNSRGLQPHPHPSRPTGGPPGMFRPMVPAGPPKIKQGEPVTGFPLFDYGYSTLVLARYAQEPGVTLSRIALSMMSRESRLQR